ncbi:MAG: methyltransferase domain-containing protein [Solirubrobacterales bacterium]|nr:methyltransferase domain-containing protein [Solirubrobacterales bacterium]
MRVAGGELRGRTLRAPRGAGELRPTTARAREAIFSILGDVSGLRVLDLFCGTGALGIEAISRGAASAVLVDSDARPARANVDALGLGGRVEAVRSDAARYLSGAEPGCFDLILCDPPYSLADRLAGTLDPLIRAALAPDGRVVTEASPERRLAVSLPVLRERRYGDTLITIHGGGANG